MSFERISAFGYPAALAVKEGGERYALVWSERVDWIAAEGDYIRLHVGSTSYLACTPLTELERSLDPNHFLRIHRSAIVNLTRVAFLEPLPGGRYAVTLQDGTKLQCSRSHRMALHERIRFLR